MCQFKSGIILKDRVFIPDYDSHTDMLQELKIEDTAENARRLFVRAELIPPNDDVFAPVSSWKYHIDQDILPEWYVAEVDEKRMRDAVTEWAKEHIHIGEKIEEITSGLHWIMDGTVGTIGGSAEIREIGGSAEVENICDTAEVENVCGSAEVKYIYGSAKVENICGSAKVKYIYGSAKVVKVYGSAKVVKVYGSAKVVNVCGSAKVVKVCGSAKVVNVFGSSTVITDSVSTWYNADAVCIKDEAVLIDRYNKKIYPAGAFETVIAGGKKDE